MFNKTKGRYQKNAHHVQSMCLSESYHFLVLGFGFFQCFCGILKLNQFTHTTDIHLLQGQKWSKQVHQTVKMFIQGQQEKITNRVNGFSKLGHWNCNLKVPQPAHLYLMVSDSTTTTKHSTIPSLCLKVFLSFFALQYKNEMQIPSKGKQYKSAFSPDKHSLVLHGCIYSCL